MKNCLILARGGIGDVLVPLFVFALWAVLGIARRFTEKAAAGQEQKKREALYKIIKHKPAAIARRDDRQGGPVRHSGAVHPAAGRQRPSLKGDLSHIARTVQDAGRQKLKEIETVAGQLVAAQRGGFPVSQPHRPAVVAPKITGTPAIRQQARRMPAAPAPSAAAEGFDVHSRRSLKPVSDISQTNTSAVLWRLLASHRSLRAGFVLSEVLGRPAALRDERFSDI